MAFLPYRMWFIVITVIMLFIAHFLVWKQKKKSKKTEKLLWISTVVSGAMILYTLIGQGL
ncbi:hypothetical protein LQ50_04220 [Halalkalibacter okhensis]|uniref:Uncharacterized protein n=1 Tax=Halalkalibacter okhensis TaxID=333138 RepID=A0A0B0IFT9_9BACI|nr:hypothetical protein LQ50_04220 [Halalkalibacter okhensis]